MSVPSVQIGTAPEHTFAAAVARELGLTYCAPATWRGLCDFCFTLNALVLTSKVGRLTLRCRACRDPRVDVLRVRASRIVRRRRQREAAR